MSIHGFNSLDLVVLGLYLVGVVAFGTLLGRKQKDARDYFLADRSIPWWAVCFSVVATETSALTFLSVPAVAYTSHMGMIQLTIGYLLGRLVIAAVLLPGYFRGELTTAYALLEGRFGFETRRFASVIFMVTRALADSVRVFVAAIPIKLLIGIPYWQAILVTGVVTLIYTYYGGLRAVVWVDVVQLIIYIFGGLAALIVLINVVPAGWAGIVEAAHSADKFRIFNLEGGFADTTWLWTGVIGGAFLSMASHGVDHLIVQRLLAAPSLKDARKAIIWSGVLIIGQFALFLLVGVGLYAFFQGQAFATTDEIFPRFIISETFPHGLTGLVIAGVLAAAMSTVAGSLNSLASATTHDLYAPLAKKEDEPEHLMRVGKFFTLAWAVILVGGAILFQVIAEGTPVVVIALEVASFTYGGLLGGFLLGVLFKKPDQRDAITGISTAIVLMTGLWVAQQFGLVPRVVANLWFALIGSAITIGVGLLSSAIRGSDARVREGAEV
jgi:SSS family transporter